MGREHSLKLNWISSYSTFPDQPFALDHSQHRPTDQHIFDSSGMNAFYKPSTTLTHTLPGKHPIIHAIQPDGSTLASAGKKSILLTNTNVAIQWVTDRHVLPTHQDHSILPMVRFCNVGFIVTFAAKEALILLNEVVVLRGIRNKNGQWYEPPKHWRPVTQLHHQSIYHKMPQTCNSIHACSPLLPHQIHPTHRHQSGISFLMALTKSSQYCQISNQNASLIYGRINAPPNQT